MAADQFDEEFERLRTYLEKKLTTLVESKFQELERKELLRLRAPSHCRICHGAEIGPKVDPPFSDDERLFHLTNHGDGIPGFERPRNWPDVERIAEAVKKARGH